MSRFRLGVPVKVLGAPLRTHDSRRWQNRPHLSVSLAYVRDVLEYLHTRGIHFYRLATQLAPYATHPQMPQFHRQVEECRTELAAIGVLARTYGIRLTIHPTHIVQVNHPDHTVAARSAQELELATAILDGMELDAEAVVVVHVGGVYGDQAAGRERFVRNYTRLSPAVRKRMALENDDHAYGLEDTSWIHRQTGVRLVLDVLHHQCINPNRIPVHEALVQALATWPAYETPKIHFSSPRTEMRTLQRQGQTYYQPPLPSQHSDFVHVFEFITFMRSACAAGARPFDVMLEAKGKDLAVLHLRKQVARFAADLAGMIG